MERRLDHIVDTLRASKKYKRRCSLLIGAGCSLSAGIPTAKGFVDLIERDHPAAHRDAIKKTYPHCMAALDSGVRRDLIADQISAARINWAHVAIAQLMAHGYVDRVLTTNFDPLVARACALVGEFPAVYDFATSTLFRPAEVAEKAIFHLHGQSTGFVLMNTEDEVSAHGQRLGPLFNDAGRGRSWIVVGYSGDNDPVFQRLAEVSRFEFGLYWIGYMDAEPREALTFCSRETTLSGKMVRNNALQTPWMAPPSPKGLLFTGSRSRALLIKRSFTPGVNESLSRTRICGRGNHRGPQRAAVRWQAGVLRQGL